MEGGKISSLLTRTCLICGSRAAVFKGHLDLEVKKGFGLKDTGLGSQCRRDGSWGQACVQGPPGEQQSQRRSPRADPQGAPTCKPWAAEEGPAEKQRLEQNETGGIWETTWRRHCREWRRLLSPRSAAAGEASLPRGRAANKERIHHSSPRFHNLQEKCYKTEKGPMIETAVERKKDGTRRLDNSWMSHQPINRREPATWAALLKYRSKKSSQLKRKKAPSELRRRSNLDNGFWIPACTLLGITRWVFAGGWTREDTVHRASVSSCDHSGE